MVSWPSGDSRSPWKHILVIRKKGYRKIALTGMSPRTLEHLESTSYLLLPENDIKNPSKD